MSVPNCNYTTIAIDLSVMPWSGITAGVSELKCVTARPAGLAATGRLRAVVTQQSDWLSSPSQPGGVNSKHFRLQQSGCPLSRHSQCRLCKTCSHISCFYVCTKSMFIIMSLLYLYLSIL